MYMQLLLAFTDNKLIVLLLLHPFSGLSSSTTWVSQYQKGKISFDFKKATDYGVLGYSGISWTIRKQSVSRSRQKTTPTPHHSIFTGQMPFLTPKQQCQSTESKNELIVILQTCIVLALLQRTLLIATGILQNISADN